MRGTATVLLALATLATLAAAGTAHAQGPPADGLYEDFSSLLMRPVGPLAATPSLLPRWVEVSTSGRVTRVTFLPDARVVWRITWGPHGPETKRTLVDGVLYTRSRFEYDAAGHLRRKVVDGPGAGGGLVYDYTTDDLGRVATRTATLPPTDAAAAAGLPSVVELVTVTWAADHVDVRLAVDGVAHRDDRLDLDGRVLSTTIHRWDGGAIAELAYARDAAGGLVSVTRSLPGSGRAPADATVPATGLSSEDVALVFGSGFRARALERHEALLFLGAPIHASDEGHGARRELHDDWGSDCWMNQISGIDFDAAAHATEGSTSCICGFCVDAALETTTDGEVLALDLHWTRGPWVRLDGSVDVTADHPVMTTTGPVAAGALAAGDVVLATDGTPRTLSSVERLPEGELRLGRNLRTEGGVFGAGGFLFASEIPRVCGP